MTPKQLSKLAGHLSSMHLTIDPLVPLFTRNMYHFIEKKVCWCEQKIVKTLKNNLNFGVTILIFTMGIHLSLDR